MQRILTNPMLAPLSVDQIRKFSPAIYANEPHESVSARYGFMPTYKVLEAMHAAGFVPVEVRNYMRRDPGRFAFTKHMIRFRQAGQLKARTVGDVVPQVVLLNAHDRSSAYELMGGLYRLVCSNGLLVSESSIVQPVKLRHTLQLAETVVETSLRIIQSHKQVFDHVKAMRAVELNPSDARSRTRLDMALRKSRIRETSNAPASDG